MDAIVVCGMFLEMNFHLEMDICPIWDGRDGRGKYENRNASSILTKIRMNIIGYDDKNRFCEAFAGPTSF